MISFIAAMAVIAFADPTPAPEGGAPPAAATAATASPKARSERVCWDEKPTGSHFPQRYCATREELEQRAKQDKDALANHGRGQPQGGFKPN